MAVVVVQWLLVLALLVGHSQGEQTAVYTGHWYIATLTGQSEASITELVDNSTLTEWGLFTGTSNAFLDLSQGLNDSVERQYLFPGMRFRCSGNVTKWTVGAGFGRTAMDRYPALGIYRDRPGGGFADRVGATILVVTNSINSVLYEFTPDPPLPFQTNDSLGIYLPDVSRLRLYHREVTGAPASRNYIPSNPPYEGVSTFDFTSAPNEETNRLPLVAVEIKSDDPDSADCTRDFISRDLLDFLGPFVFPAVNNQIVFPSYNFTSDGVITSWTLAAWWPGEGNRFPELQIWRRSGDTYNRTASTELTATTESPNQLYSGTIDPPLQFQSGDALGIFIPPDSQLQVLFAAATGPIYVFRVTNVSLSTVVLGGQETNNHRPLLALETLSTAVTPVSSLSTTGASPPTELMPVTAIAVGASVGGVILAAAVTVLIIVAAVVCARNLKKNQEPKQSVCAINMTATVEEEPYYDYPFQTETTNESTEHSNTRASITIITTELNEAYITSVDVVPPELNEGTAVTAITTEQNEAYDATYATINTEQNEAYIPTYDSITTEQNEDEAYATITTEHNEAYAATVLTARTEQNEVYALPTAPNPAYSSTGVPLQSSEGYATTPTDYDYISKL